MRVSAGTLAKWFALMWAVAAYAYLLFAPSYETASSTSAGTLSTGTRTLLEVNGRRVLYVLAFPVIVAATTLLPVPVAARRLVVGIAAALAIAFVILGAWTVGLFFLPTAIALMIATANSPSSPAT